MRLWDKTQTIFAIILSFFLAFSCVQEKAQQEESVDAIIAKADIAAFPAFTTNRLGEPVLWWAETDTAAKKSAW